VDDATLRRLQAQVAGLAMLADDHYRNQPYVWSGEPGWRYQWRVSALIWPPSDDQPHRMHATHDDEAAARQQMDGLLEMADKHAVRPCGGHVWTPKLERRTIWESAWAVVDG
jgi:hypothetical protein